MRRLLPIFLFLFTLSACGSTAEGNIAEQPAAVSAVVPTTCDLEAVNAAFGKIIPPSQYIPTDWKPAAGTDLYAAINGGGIACSYGDQPAEIGGTILWAADKDGLWKSREEQWKADGMQTVDIPNINESAAYKLPDGATAADGMPAWKVNLLIDGMWIQLGAAFIQSWDEATPIIQAAIDATKVN